ncbi:MAG: hypothetical protein Q9207_007971 [Kuettlingeria erythrocarpa]
MTSSSAPTVILSGGIIGFATAYYLATSQGDCSDVTIIDNSPTLFEGASGQANGILGAYGFDPALAPLANLSYDLHKELAANHDGRENWGFSPIVTHALNNKSHSTEAVSTDHRNNLSVWFKDDEAYSDEITGDEHDTSRFTSGNHLVLRIPGYEGGRPHCDQIFLEGIIGQKVDISDFQEGSLYVGGYITKAEELPETVMEVKPQEDSVHEMKTIAMDFLACANKSDIEVLDVGRAYRPFLTMGRPVIAKAALHELLNKPQEVPAKGNAQTGGVFFNVGHGSDGITLGPGSGKVMSELIRTARRHSSTHPSQNTGDVLNAKLWYLKPLDLYRTLKPYHINLPVNALPPGVQSNEESEEYQGIIIRNIRGKESTFNLDRNDFQVFTAAGTNHSPFTQAKSVYEALKEKEYSNADVVRERYYPAVEAFLKTALGAEKALAFTHDVSHEPKGI